MKIIRWSMMGLMMIAPLVFGGTLAHAFTLPANSVPSTQTNITPKHINSKIVPKKTGTANAQKTSPAKLHGGVSQHVGTLKKNAARPALRVPKPFLGRGKPVTSRDGKSLIPAKIGPLHTLGGGAPAIPHGGFATVPAARPLVGRGAPVIGRDGKSLIPAKTDPLHVLDDDAPAIPHGGFAAPPAVRPLIGRGAPVTGQDGKSLLPGIVEVPRLSLAVEGIFEDGSGVRRLDEVAPGEHVYIRVALRNTGLADSEPILVGSDRYGDRGPFTLRPGDVMHLQYTDTVGTDHMDSENKMWFRGGFVLRSPSGAPVRYQNENAADDHLRLMSSSLAVTGISDVRLNYNIVPLPRHNHLPGHLENGFDVKVNASVIVKNTGRFASLPTTMNISLIAEQPANYHAHLHEGGDSGMKVVRSVSGDVNPKLSMSIPAIQAGEIFTQSVFFARLPHQLWDMDSYYKIFGVRHHSHYPVLAGTYACSHISVHPDGHRITPAWAGTQVRVRAEIARNGGGVAQFSRDGVTYSSAKSITGTLGNTNSYGCSLK